MLTVREVAARLKLSKVKVYQLIAEGSIACLHHGPKSIRVTEEALQDYIQRISSSPTTHVKA